MIYWCNIRVKKRDLAQVFLHLIREISVIYYLIKNVIWRVFWKYFTINNPYCIEIPDVQVESDEDIFAIKALNLYLHLKNVKSLKLCREVPVFGWIGNLFLLGKIDELRHVDKDNSIELSEFKTRTKSYLPSAAQQKTHNLQVMIYKVRNFNDLIN